MEAQFCLILIFIAARSSWASTNIRPDQLFLSPMQEPLQWKTPTTVSQETAAASPLPPPPAISFNNNYPTSSDDQRFDQRVSDVIAFNVLRFAHDVGQQLAASSENAYASKNEIFSPLSVMSALALLMLGAKGKSYQELKQVFGLDYDTELSNNPSKFHKEFGLMIADIQRLDQNAAHRRTKPNWRNTNAHNSNIRGGGSNAASNKPIQHVVKLANGLFEQIGYSLNPNYRNVVQTVYNSEIIQLDFQTKATAARDYINAWVNSNTYGKIPTIINGAIPSSTNLIIASALYFKGFWENSFFVAATALDNFYPDGPAQQPIKVQMMATGGVFPFYESVEHDCRIIGLPYKGNLTTMYVIQPNHSTRAKLREFQKHLNWQQIEELISKMTQKTAVLALPKMHIVRNINMKNILHRLGLSDIFTSRISDLSLIGGIPQTYASVVGNRATPIGTVPAATAAKPQQHTVRRTRPIYPQFTPSDRFIFDRFGDFDLNSTESSTDKNQEDSEMEEGVKEKREVPATRNSLANLEAQRNAAGSHRSDLFVEDIVHKVDFDVNEFGTEAAAATLTYLRRSGTDVLFRAESPFLVLIRHDPTKLVLFYGIINEPELN